MMFLRTAILLAVFCFAVGTLRAETIRFRSGYLLNAELTSRNINIAKSNADAFPKPPAKKIFAVVTLKLDPPRSISIFDYSLELFGTSWPCVAIWRNGRFEYFDDRYASNTPIQLLFIIDELHISKNNHQQLKLKCNIPPSDGTYDTDIPFRNIGNQSPAAPSQVPADGKFKGIEE